MKVYIEIGTHAYHLLLLYHYSIPSVAIIVLASASTCPIFYTTLIMLQIYFIGLAEWASV